MICNKAILQWEMSSKKQKKIITFDFTATQWDMLKLNCALQKARKQ